MNRIKNFSVKLNNIFNNKEGSALFFVMMAVMILAVLSSILLSMSMVNSKMKKSNIIVKKNRYYTESGIDQVYAKIGGRVANSLIEAENGADDFVNDTLGKLEEIISYIYHWTTLDADGNVVNHYENRPDMHPEYASNQKYLKNSGKDINDVKVDGLTPLESDAKDEFQNKYKQALETDIADFLTYLNDSSNYEKDENVKVQEIKVELLDLDKFEERTDDTVMVFSVKSRVEYVDDSEKLINTDIVVNKVNKEYEYKNNQKEYYLADNPAWQKAILLSDDLVVNGDANIRGDIFDYAGHNVSTYMSDDPSNFGGVKVESGTLKVDGNVISSAYVQLAKNSTGSMDINGLVHANTVITQVGSTGILDVEKNVYTRDDLELNGDGSKIIIGGNYYGYYDYTGSFSGSSVSDTHDNSSAIIINASDNTSRLIINGNDAYKKAGYDGGTFIAGYSFINNEGDKYITGESISFKRNTAVYTADFSMLIPNDEDIEEQKSGYDMIKENDFLLIKSLDNKPKDEYQTLDSLTYARATANSEDETNTGYLAKNTSVGNPKFNRTYKVNGTDAVLQQNDRKALFLGFQETYDKGNDFLFKGSGNVDEGPFVDISSYFYTVGLRLSRDSYALKKFNNGFGEEKSASANNNRQIKLISSSLKYDLYDDYLYYLNKLRKRLGNTAENMREDFEGVRAMTKIEYSNINRDSNGDLVKYVNTNDSDTYIVGYGAEPPVGETSFILNEPNKEYKGIIVAKGDIHFIGELNFKGPVISASSIYFDSGSNVNIDNNLSEDAEELSPLDYEQKKEIASMIYEDEELRNFFDIAGLDVFEWTVNNISTEESTDRNPAQNYDNYIGITHWSVEDK